MKADQFNFHGQRPDETVLVVVKQHTWLLMPVVWFWLVVAIILGVLIWFYSLHPLIGWLALGLLLVGLIFTFYRWYLWSNGFYIITNQRVIRIDQRSFFNRVISEAEINRIQEISTNINGPVKTMLNFGTVKIQTASTSTQISLDNVPDPYNLQQVIVRIQRGERHRPSGP